MKNLSLSCSTVQFIKPQWPEVQYTLQYVAKALLLITRGNISPQAKIYRICGQVNVTHIHILLPPLFWFQSFHLI